MLHLLLVLALGAPLAAPPAATAPAAATAQDAEALLAGARRLEARGDLAQAREAWLAAAPLLPLGAERDAAVGAAHALEDRLAVRAEIVAALEVLPDAFAPLGFESADSDEVVLGGERLPWVEIDLALVRRALTAARGSASAKRGLVQEALARGTSADRRTALGDLGRMLERKQIAASDAFAAVARARGERIPEGGYEFQKGVWRRVDQLAATAAANALDAAAIAFEDAGIDQRDAALAALEARGTDGVARAAQALEARWQAAHAALRRGTRLELLRALADQRAELDLRRQSALELIFDEERYFYPYAPPACPPDKARHYAAVQREVDVRVEHVRELWRAGRRVALPAPFRAALEELAWNRAVQRARKLEFAWPDDVPGWASCLDPARDAVDLAGFAWNAEEAAGVARDHAVLVFNAARWKRGGDDDQRTPNAEERRQVEITNEYRRLLGRRLLAWNPKIQAAAQLHADYMSRTGDFGHEQPDPRLRGPRERMESMGYAQGGGENCHMGGGGPEGAHVGWTHSSGHHRNLLQAGHREMASAVAGSYWCQNFGSGAEHEADAH